jgi:hypothetical protein
MQLSASLQHAKVASRATFGGAVFVILVILYVDRSFALEGHGRLGEGTAVVMVVESV